MLQRLNAASLPKASGAYSHTVVAGGFVFTSGFGPHDPISGNVVGIDIKSQTVATLSNVVTAVELGGSSVDHIVKVSVHLAHLDDDFAAFDDAYREFFGSDLPVRTTTGSPLGGILIEVDAIAVVLDSAREGLRDGR
jgi:enamine deaminase RidA (YjgF/YER057c/UK114 family)